MMMIVIIIIIISVRMSEGFVQLNPFIPRVSYGLAFESVDEILWCDIQMTPRQQCFHVVLFIFSNA